MQPRKYQQQCIDKFWESIHEGKDSFAVCVPTGGGKTIIMAKILLAAKEQGIKSLVLCRSKELVLQNIDKYRACGGTGEGIYSAGLSQKDRESDVSLGTGQSMVNATCFGSRKLIIVDEAHQVPERDSSQYQSLLEKCADACPGERIVLFGLTATPYRMDGGPLCGEEKTFKELVHSVPIAELIDDGYLTKPVNIATELSADMSGVSLSGKDFNRAQMEEQFLSIRSLPDSILRLSNQANRESVLVFASGVSDAERVCLSLQEKGETSEFITGETPPLMRQSVIDSFCAGDIRFLVNCEVLTTGFDCPRIDAIVLARATLSPGLYYQMLGRGFRLFPGKESFSVMDYGGNAERHGPIDSPDFGVSFAKQGNGECPKKNCPHCGEQIPLGITTFCPICLGELPKNEQERAYSLSPVSVIDEIGSAWLKVVHTQYKLWKKPLKTPSIRVGYLCRSADWDESEAVWIHEWVCPEHQGFARERAVEWFYDRGVYDVPWSAEESLKLTHRLPDHSAIKVTRQKNNPKYFRVEAAKLHKLPEFARQDDEAPW